VPKITMAVNELSDAQPTRVSLVKHAANRTPFRIMKEDNEMTIDLSKAFGAVRSALARKSEAPTQVVAVVVRKGFDIAPLQPKLEQQGLSFASKTEKDDLVLYLQPGAVMGERTGVLKFDDNTALLIGNLHAIREQVPVKKDFDSYDADATTFMDALNTRGFYPSICISVEALQTCIFNCVDEADTTDEAAALVEAAIDSFKDWIMGCVRGIPVRAFKAEGEYAAVHAANAGTANAAAVGPLGADPANASLSDRQLAADNEVAVLTEAGQEIGAVIVTKAEAAIGVQTTAETSPTNAAQAAPRLTGSGGKNPQIVGNAGSAPIGTDTQDETAPAEAAQEAARLAGHGGKLPEVTGTGEAPKGVEQSAEASPVNASQVMKTELAALLAPLTAALTGVQTDVAALGTRVAKAEEAIGGTVLAAPNEDPSDRRRARKAEGSGVPALLDTAYDRSHLRIA
jgi:hypothetical protein